MLEAIKKNGGAVYLAARELGCAPNTIYNRMEKVPAMKQAVENARGEVVDYAEQKLRLAVLNGEPWAIGMTLKTIGGRECLWTYERMLEMTRVVWER